MKTATLLVAMLLCGSMAYAQNDPVVMTVNGAPVSRSEFEYSYNKNNSEGVIDKKTVGEYVDLFVNYKLKVQAALDACLDTMSSFKKEFREYRDQQVRPTLVTDADVEAKARDIYRETQQRVDGGGGLLKTSHILLLLDQNATKTQQDAAKVRIDSVYNALKKGADFADLARRLSDDKSSAVNGGQLPWIERNQLVKAYEDVAYALKKGEISKPFLSEYGYHIVKLDDKQPFFPYDSVKTSIYQFIESRGLRDAIVTDRLQEEAKVGNTTPEQLLDAKTEEVTAKDDALKYLIKEYHDGLLLYEISNRTVWDKAAKDEAGLSAYFAKNKKKYRWEEPHFKGIAYHVKTASDVDAVKRSIKGKPFAEWADILRTTFNNDSVLRIRVEKGIFKKGDNAVVDKEVFKVPVTVKPVEGYPIDATFGKVLKNKPEDYQDVRALVVADYQDALEKQWVESLRKKYTVVINKEVLATVNKHQ